MISMKRGGRPPLLRRVRHIRLWRMWNDTAQTLIRALSGAAFRKKLLAHFGREMIRLLVGRKTSTANVGGIIADGARNGPGHVGVLAGNLRLHERTREALRVSLTDAPVKVRDGADADSGD